MKEINQTMSNMDMTGISNALKIAEERMENKSVEVRSILILLKVADAPETPMSEIEKAVGLSQAAVSRNIGKLGDGIFKDVGGEKVWVPGLKLVESYEDPRYRRRNLVRMTDKGRALVKDMLIALQN